METGGVNVDAEYAFRLTATGSDMVASIFDMGGLYYDEGDAAGPVGAGSLRVRHQYRGGSSVPPLFRSSFFQCGMDPRRCGCSAPEHASGLPGGLPTSRRGNCPPFR